MVKVLNEFVSLLRKTQGVNEILEYKNIILDESNDIQAK